MRSVVSYTARLRALFWIAASNFVIPVIFNIAQLVLIFHDESFVHGTYVLLVNIYVEIVSVLLATLWCSSSLWENATFSAVREAPSSFEGGEHRPVESLGEVKFASPNECLHLICLRRGDCSDVGFGTLLDVRLRALPVPVRDNGAYLRKPSVHLTAATDGCHFPIACRCAPVLTVLVGSAIDTDRMYPLY